MDNTAFLDLAIIGGGISGLGVLRAATAQGLRTVLFEKGALMNAASASSLRIIHGGFRYLQSLDIPRVIESCRDQHSLLRDYPAFIRPLPCVMPLKRWGMKSRYPVLAASLVYRLLGSLCCGASVYAGVRGKEWVRQDLPLIEDVSSHGVLYWNDALLVDPEGFAQTLRSEVSTGECSIRENTLVTKITPSGDFFDIEFAAPGDRVESVRVAQVVNTSGAWIGTLNERFCTPTFAWCKAFNIILNRQFEPRYGIGLPGNTRLYFLVPRDSVSVLGTEYIPFDGRPEDASVSEQEIASFLREFNTIFPAVPLSISDVSRVESAVLPMRGLKNAYPRLYGMERIYLDGQYIEVLSTKYTTFQAQARKVLRVVRKRS